MPKIEVDAAAFSYYFGKTLDKPELEKLFPCAKAELDGIDHEDGILKVELNDTNRPDLWSTAGLARQLKIYAGGDIPSYPFFSSQDRTEGTGDRVVTVDPALEHIRPYITAFAVTGKPLDEPGLKDLIQTQEKLCWNYGQKRKSIAMGVYRSDLIKYPVRYVAADPDTTKFIPLGYARELTLRQICREHPKGQDFGHIVEDFPAYPYITDVNGEVLSFPPVINSARIGAVELGDENLFIELTGLDIHTLTLAASIVACDLADGGYTILPVRIEYPFDTPFGRECVTPHFFQETVEVGTDLVNRLLGKKYTPEEAVETLLKMGVHASVRADAVQVTPPAYRNDFLHPVDVVEDIMIGTGMDNFEPVMPEEFTVGRYTPETKIGREVKDIMTGLGFQEMIYNYLGSGQDFFEKMNISEEGTVRIANPMTENYEYVRSSILPNLLASESVSSNAVYPHYIFEVGKVAVTDNEANYGSVTKNYLGFLSADKNADFNLVNSHVSALFFYLSGEYSLAEYHDQRLIPGRGAAVLVNGRKAGFFGEIHPSVLENWGIQMPVTVCEIEVDLLLREDE
jgi:phenylalanyl-tRNA synthetase beta chain